MREKIYKETETIDIPECYLEQAGINPNEQIDAILGEGFIVIKPRNILGRLPEDLLLFYESLGFKRELVKEVLEKEAEKVGSIDELVRDIKKFFNKQ